MINTNNMISLVLFANSDNTVYGWGMLILFILSIWGTREAAYKTDMQLSDRAANPKFVKIKREWCWLFKFQRDTYVRKILQTSFLACCIGYFFALLQLLLMIYTVLVESMKLKQLYNISMYLFLISMLSQCGITLLWGFKHEYRVRKAYEYDIITYFKEKCGFRPRRKCIVEQELADNVYLVRLGHIKKSYFRALSEVPVDLGSKMYAVHVDDEKNVNWILKEDKFKK